MFMFYSDVTSILKALQGKKEVDTGHSVFFLKITSQLKKKKKKNQVILTL